MLKPVTAKNPPQKLLFLDCEKTVTGRYALTWALPNVEAGGDPITNVVIERKGSTGDWQSIEGPVEGNSFLYTGFAEEFQVAAENKHGIGKFSSCVPTCDISDEKLLDIDRAALENNKETFAQMSCVDKIIIRLSSRRLLHQAAEERLSRCFTRFGAFQAALKLVEEMLRCNYQELYLFKKTLEEFRQENLAALVPVRKTNDVAFDEELDDPSESIAESSVVVPRREDPQSGHTQGVQTSVLQRERHLVIDADVGIQTDRVEIQFPQQEPQPPVQTQYTLLDELSNEQKNYCPDEKLFGRIICCQPDIHVLGANLGFSLTEIEGFRNYQPTSVPAQALKMLVTWRKRGRETATVGRLVEALTYTQIAEDSYKQAVLDYFGQLDKESDDGTNRNFCRKNCCTVT